MGGAALILYQQSLNEQRNDIIKNFDKESRRISDIIQEQFFERYGDVQAFATNTVLRSKDAPAIQKALNKYVQLYRIYDVILFVDTDGNPIASNTKDLHGNPINVEPILNHSHASTPWFRAAISRSFTEDQGKGFAGTYFQDAMVDPITSKVYGERRLGTSFSTLVKDGQNVVGVLTTRANFKWVERVFQSRYKALKNRNLGNTQMNLLNHKGEVLVDYDPSSNGDNTKIIRDFDNTILKLNLAERGLKVAQEVIAGHRGAELAENLRKNIVQLAGFSPVEGNKFLESISWGILVRVDAAEVFAVLDAAKRNFFLTLGIVFIIATAVVILLATSIVKKLTRISTEIASSGTAVGSASNQLSGASQQLSSGATEAASSLEETVSSLEEITSMVKVNAENANQAATLSQNSSTIAKEGEQEVQNLIASITEISDSSQKIEEIINVIDDIAFQTNLLALNAAVEAARAGEQGKGFAVVAEAVRNLAQRSATAAKEINGLIKENVSKIDRGTKIADKSGDVLQQILTSVQKVNDLNNEIAAASKEQSNGLSQVNKAMNELDQSTQRNAAASEEVAASSEELNSQATVLQNLVNDLDAIVIGAKQANSHHSAMNHHGQQHNVVSFAQNRKGPVPRSQSHVRSDSHQGDPEKFIPFKDDDEPKENIGSVSGF
jgi:methyl-accepting chemotaxis protein